ncbi:MAG: hypothetical protein ACKOUK_06635 [Verrucomicrobiota bacterium]
MADDPFAQRLRLIGTLTRLFRERGWDLGVEVGAGGPKARRKAGQSR